ALAHFEPEPTFHQWLWFAVADVVEARRAEAPDLEHVAEAPGRDERDAHAPSLDDRVGGDRRAMGELRDRGGGHAGLRQKIADTGLYRRAVVLRRGQYLLTEEPSVAA